MHEQVTGLLMRHMLVNCNNVNTTCPESF